MKEKKIYENSIIIAPRESFKYFYAYRREFPLVDFSLYTKEEAENFFAFQYKDAAIIYLLKQGYSFEESKEILKSIKFLDKDSYGESKLDSLVKIRDELLKNNLIYKQAYVEKLFENKQIVFHGYKNVKFLSSLLNKAGWINSQFDIVEKPTKKEPKILVFKDTYQEVHHLMNSICELLEKGQDINNIYIAGVDDEYAALIREFAPLYKFPVDLKPSRRLIETPLVRDFIKNLETNNVDEALYIAKANYIEDINFNDFNLTVLNYKIQGLSKEKQTSIYREIFSLMNCRNASFVDAVRLLNGYFIPESSNIFYVGFALNNAPKISTDTDYLFDKEKELVGVPTSFEMNEDKMDQLSDFIYSPNLIYASRSTVTRSKGAIYPSPVVIVKKIKEEIVDSYVPSVEYSEEFARYWGMNLLDRKVNLNIPSEIGDYLIDKFNLDFRWFEEANDFKQFKPVSDDEVINYSYTKLNSFKECPFKFYCQYILKLGKFEQTFNTRLGTLLHAMVELNPTDETLDKEWHNAIARIEEEEKIAFSPKERFFLENLKPEIQGFLKFMNEMESELKSKSIYNELGFNGKITNTIGINGRVDKLVLTGDKQEYASIIDYKTSVYDQFNEKLIKHGIHMQLPFYVYLLKNAVSYSGIKFDDKEVIGLFLNQLLRKKKVDGSKTFEDMIKNECKLNGLLSPDKTKTSSFKSNFNDYCKGAYKNSVPESRQLTKEDYDYFVNLVDEVLKDADKKIRNGEFNYAPKQKGSTFNSCNYCSFRQICFRRNRHIEVLEDEDESDGNT